MGRDANAIIAASFCMGSCEGLIEETMKKRLQFSIGILISLLFLYLAMRRVEWQEMTALLQSANYWYLIPAFLLLASISFVRAYRWRLLMWPEAAISIRRLFRFVNIGYFFNNVFPAKAGELVRAYLAGRSLTGGVAQALSAILIERLLDVLSVVILLIGMIPLLELPTWATRGGLLAGAVAILGLLFLGLASIYAERAVSWIWRIMGRLPLIGTDRVREGLTNLLKGFSILRQPRLFLGIVGSSAVIWFGYACLNYLFLMVFRMDDLPFTAAFFVLCCTGLSMILPSSPGAMGVFEWAAIQALALFSVGQSSAFSYALGLHVFTNLTLILLGLLGMMQEGLGYNRLQEEAIREQESIG